MFVAVAQDQRSDDATYNERFHDFSWHRFVRHSDVPVSEAETHETTARTRMDVCQDKWITTTTPTVQVARSVNERTDQGIATGTLQEWVAEPPPDHVRRPAKKNPLHESLARSGQGADGIADPGQATLRLATGTDHESESRTHARFTARARALPATSELKRGDQEIHTPPPASRTCGISSRKKVP